VEILVGTGIRINNKSRGIKLFTIQDKNSFLKHKHKCLIHAIQIFRKKITLKGV
jgi:hypothetical protein